MSDAIFMLAELWFDYQPVGSTTALQLRVMNPGPGNRTLTVEGAGFGFGDPATTLRIVGPQLGEQTVTLTFHPTEDRPYTATLKASDGGGSVTLLGVGVRAADAAGAFTAEESDPDGTGPKGREINRLQLHVPFSETYLVMGRGLKGSTATYDGFGVRTKRRVFISAEENVVIQSAGDSIFKAYGEKANLYAVAKQHAVVAAKGAASLLGSGGALIFGGLGGGSLTVNAESGDRDDPLDVDGDDSAESVRQNRNYVAAAFLGLDVMLGVGLFANTVYQTGRTVADKTEDKKIRKTASALVAGTATALGVALSSSAMANSINSDVPGPAGTTIFGEAGVLTGTYGFNASYALGGIAGVAPFTMSFGLAEATVASLHTTSLTSYFGTVAIDGKTKVKVHSAKKVGVTAGDMLGDGQVIVDAGQIAIGAQDKTVCSSLTLKTNAVLPTPMTESELKMQSGEMVLNAGTSLKIKVGEGPQGATVSINSQMVTIAAGKRGASISLLPDGSADLVGQGTASMRSKTGSSVEAALDVAITASMNVKISGKKVNIM